jgi:ATP-binding protein involved in chromosome partitioning
MSFFECTNCNHTTHIFGQDGAKEKAKELNIDILADLPLHQDVCITSDNGKPIVISQPNTTHSHIYKTLARKLVEKCNKILI